MKLKKLITIVVMLMLSVTVALSATACFGGGDDGATYTVTFDANGGSMPNDVTTMQVTVGKNYTLPTPTKTGFTFDAWESTSGVVAVSGTWKTESDVSLKAKWVAKTTAVTLDVAGGAGASSTNLTATYGQVLALPTLTKVGYNFAGWTLNGQAYDATSAWAVEDATATLVATWEAKASSTTVVTLDVQGGVGATETTLTATYGETLTLPTLTKVGYNFAGWTLNGQAYDATSAWALEDATATLVATWTIKTTAVTLDVQGGVGATETTLTATYGQVLTLPTLTKAGFDFAGWTLNGQAYDVASAWAVEDATATLVATWEANAASTTVVTLNVDGGVGATETELTATYGQVLELPTLTKVGYNFAGWTLNGQAYDVASAWAVEDATATLVATWTAKTTNITLELDGGEYTGDLTFVATYGQAFTLAKPTKDGYAFAGWTLNGQAYDATSAWALEDASATLVATWEVKGTTVTLELDGGEYAGDTELNAIVGQVLQLTNPTKTGYNFTGWTLNGQAYDATSAWTLEVETATLFANWEVKTTLVTLDVDGGEYTGDLTFVATYGQAFTLAKPTKVGYAFAGWTLNGQAYDVASAWAIEDAAATLVANWTAKTTNITLELDGGEYTGDLTFVATYGQAFTLAKPTKVGFVFGGWTLNGQAYDVTSAWALEDKTATLTAVWTQNPTTITIDVNGGDELPENERSILGVFGEQLNLPTVTRTGYDLAGWKLDGEDYDAKSLWNKDGGEATLVAQWKLKTTQVTFNVDGGSDVDGATFKFGEAPYANAEDVPTTTKANHNFAGWLLNGEEIDLTAAWMIEDKAVELVAKWTGAKINVTIKYQGVDIEDSVQEVEFGSSYTLISTRPYHKLSRLVVETTGEEVPVSGDAWLYSEDLVLIAETVLKTFNVTVKGCYGETIGTFSVEYGQDFSLDSYNPSTDAIYVEKQETINTYDPETGEVIGSVTYTVIKEMFFDGFRIEGTETKYSIENSKNFVWNYDADSEDVTIIATYESEDIWI